MALVNLDNLTPRQRKAFILRFQRRWRLRRIAAELGIAISSACELVKRAQSRAGLGKRRVPVIRTKPRAVRVRSLTPLERDV